MRTVFLSHPFAENPGVNVARVITFARRIALEGHLPLAPHLLFRRVLDERTERELALRLCLRLVSLSNEVRVFGQSSEGMRLELAEAERLGIPVVYVERE